LSLIVLAELTFHNQRLKADVETVEKLAVGEAVEKMWL
jgi:hypothetical protein